MSQGREESVEEFVRRNLGDEVFERLIEPFCSGDNHIAYFLYHTMFPIILRRFLNPCFWLGLYSIAVIKLIFSSIVVMWLSN